MRRGENAVRALPPAYAPPSRPVPPGLDLLLDATIERVAEAVAERLAPLLERTPAPVLLDRRGLAEALAVGVDTVDKLRREALPELRVGDVPRFRLDAVLEWLRGRT